MEKRLGSYRELVNGFLNRGYETCFFSVALKPESQLILRHDIDFDCGYAWEIAQLEKKMGVNATYFFLLRSDSYNLLSVENADFVKRIRDVGHSISLHFDPTIYGNDFIEGFQRERLIFESFFDEELKIISIHRPNSFFLNYDEMLDGIEHTYQNKFFKEMKYISDSQGEFRFGHPFETLEFKTGKSIHLLTHPIWWQGGDGSNIRMLQNYIAKQQAFLTMHVAKNCIPYQEHLNKR